MPVVSAHRIWPFPHIPYCIGNDQSTENTKKLEAWVTGFNDQLGYALLKPHAKEASRLLLKVGGGKSENIGYEAGETLVTGSSAATLHHEILHALGFHHEQYHQLFPWNDADTTWESDATTWNHALHAAWAKAYATGLAGRMEDLLGKAKTSDKSSTSLASLGLDVAPKKPATLQPKKAHDLSGLNLDVSIVSHKPQGKGTKGSGPVLPLAPKLPDSGLVDSQTTKTAAANVAQQLKARKACVDEPKIEHSDAGADLDAVMMYSEARKAAESCFAGSQGAKHKPVGANQRNSGKCQLGAKTLSNDEVAALKKYYPQKAKQD